ncbi:2-C-methyl-D-erythritol 4-phosphate cytidylyltransferase [Arcicella lustrica]|uniref:2-C-methyl-D-erythritol 4-phosphate cytidylyltransferase n=1 Tax=Arcicella lustrica TaxID=2984196 RepID=A0ABU5SNN5_9BACT|nr:2-C-methyl-D-erythritol 4-phosphate cytidylyltransferase [Arcicella sp. DC25W]MEA5428875.1 2-C-methyl-D-erythritol 4-phosphate cytidylyltransferase [Arcicella sp. DC25W]
MKKYAIIVAGGSGSRMRSNLPKQFIEIGRLPVLMHTLIRFKEAFADIDLILVLPESQFDFWKELCQKHHFTVAHQLVKGGNSRFQSGKNGLAVIETDGIVAVHDGVRPFVSKDIIRESFEVAQAKGTAVVSVASKDSVRVNGQAIDRQTVRLIQTPQTFQVSIIKKAFETEELSTFTDDASVVEFADFDINLIEGSYENIKITTPEDLEWAEIILKRNA